MRRIKIPVVSLLFHYLCQQLLSCVGQTNREPEEPHVEASLTIILLLLLFFILLVFHHTGTKD